MDNGNDGGNGGNKSNSSANFLGFLMGLAVQFPHLINCLKNCDSWILKVETILSYLAVTFGFTKPGQLIFKILKTLLNDVSMKIWGVPYQMNREMGRAVQFALSFGGQYGLSGVWDWAKDSTVCLKNNDCEGSAFLNYVQMTKSTTCGVDEDNLCNQIMSETPLILLILVVLVLYIFSKYEIGDDDYDDDDDDDVENLPPQPIEDVPFSSGPEPDSDPNFPPYSSNFLINNLHQKLQAKCPHCEKTHTVVKLKPTPKFCKDCENKGSQSNSGPTVISSTSSPQDSLRTTNENTTIFRNTSNNSGGSGDAVPAGRGSCPPSQGITNTAKNGLIKKIITAAVNRQVNEVIKLISQGACSECQDHLTTILNCANANAENENTTKDGSTPCPTCSLIHRL